MEFQRSSGAQVVKIMEIPGDRGSTVKPLRMDNPGGWVSNWKKTFFQWMKGVVSKETVVLRRWGSSI